MSRRSTLTDAEQTIQKIIGQRLRETREGLGMSRKRAELATGINAIRLASYERGARSVSASTLVLIAAAYGVDVTRLLPTSGVPARLVLSPAERAAVLREVADDLDGTAVTS